MRSSMYRRRKALFPNQCLLSLSKKLFAQCHPFCLCSAICIFFLIIRMKIGVFKEQEENNKNGARKKYGTTVIWLYQNKNTTKNSLTCSSVLSRQYSIEDNKCTPRLKLTTTKRQIINIYQIPFIFKPNNHFQRDG